MEGRPQAGGLLWAEAQLVGGAHPCSELSGIKRSDGRPSCLFGRGVRVLSCSRGRGRRADGRRARAHSGIRAQTRALPKVGCCPTAVFPSISLSFLVPFRHARPNDPCPSKRECDSVYASVSSAVNVELIASPSLFSCSCPSRPSSQPPPSEHSPSPPPWSVRAHSDPISV